MKMVQTVPEADVVELFSFDVTVKIIIYSEDCLMANL